MELSKIIDGTMLLAPVASSTADNTSAEIDSANYGGVLFVHHAGTLGSGTCVMQIEGAASTSDTFQALSGATVTSTAGDGPQVVNVHKPRDDFRWMRVTLTHAGALECGGITAFRYGPREIPTTWSTTSAAAQIASVVSPGT